MKLHYFLGATRLGFFGNPFSRFTHYLSVFKEKTERIFASIGARGHSLGFLEWLAMEYFGAFLKTQNQNKFLCCLL